MERVVVVGAGTMGHGIAHVAAQAGFQVTLVDLTEELVRAGLARIAENLARGVEKGKVRPEDRDRALGRITPSTSLEEAAAAADLLVEAVPEVLELKVDTFRQVSRSAGPEAILATNTSSLPVTEIAAAASNPGRVIGLHFFNPPHLMPLVEVVRAEQTSAATLDATLAAVRRMGKETIVVRDSPGFATSRLGVAIGLEAMRMLAAGVASVEDIDRAMELGYRHPMGPLKLTDLVGLDVRLAIAEHLDHELGGGVFHPPPILRGMVRAGRLGKKAGRGFYLWDESGPRPAPPG